MTTKPQRMALAVAGLMLTATGLAPAQPAHAATTEPDEGDRAVACQWAWKDRSGQTAKLLPGRSVRSGPYRKCADRDEDYGQRMRTVHLDCFVRNKYQHTWWHVRLLDGTQGWVWAGNLSTPTTSTPKGASASCPEPVSGLKRSSGRVPTGTLPLPR